MSWSRGYFVTQGYTYGYYHEISPLALSWGALIHGHISPLHNFNYLELGCGQGISLIMNAANHPDAHFVGVDFMPDHIQHARDLTKKLGLTNIEFHEFDFTSTNLEIFGQRKYQFISAHGITTWVSSEVRSAMSRLIDELLDIGGVFYNSYNTPQYWQHLMTFQHLARTLSKQEGGVQGLNRAKEIFDFINVSMSDFYDQNPYLKKKLEGFKDQSFDYLVHEFCNQNWRLVFFDEEYQLNSAIKLNYLGSLNLLENFEKFFPVDLLEKIKNENFINKELIKDIYLGQAFRRDLWIRGRAQSTTAEQIELICQLSLIKNINRPNREDLNAITLQSGGIKINSKNPILLGLISNSEKNPFALSELKSMMDTDLNEFYRLVSLLLASGNVSLEYKPSLNSININSVLLQLASEGKPYGWLQAPKIKSAVSINTIDLILMKALVTGASTESVAQMASSEFKKRGNQLIIEGKELSNSESTAYFVKYIQQDKFVEQLNRLNNHGVFQPPIKVA